MCIIHLSDLAIIWHLLGDYGNYLGDVSFLVEILKERFRQHIVYLI